MLIRIIPRVQKFSNLDNLEFVVMATCVGCLVLIQVTSEVSLITSRQTNTDTRYTQLTDQQNATLSGNYRINSLSIYEGGGARFLITANRISTNRRFNSPMKSQQCNAHTNLWQNFNTRHGVKTNIYIHGAGLFKCLM